MAKYIIGFTIQILEAPSLEATRVEALQSLSSGQSRYEFDVLDSEILAVEATESMEPLLTAEAKRLIDLKSQAYQAEFAAEAMTWAEILAMGGDTPASV